MEENFEELTWENFGINDKLIEILRQNNFENPTEI